MAQQQILDKASAAMGEPVVDAVVIMHRPVWAYAFFAIMLVPIALKLSFGITILAGALAGALIAAVSTFKFVARSATRLALLDSTKMLLARPTRLDRVLTADEIVNAPGRGLNGVVVIDGTRYIVSRVLSGRLAAILGRPA